ncbi:T9SS type A sorting domain-containing protein [Paracrocinitomix mangrovi]|uniref:T9SS type A sorting domain-containing protein n=1 Tax=Paracrocinitomix mangrovi TaxID=2862509 RepID=UPI001C8EB568|nr:T9SS type A sorting domain-containing protein [Paracrocinitomix mangrovi]UKN01184.1 T9SS type A sorting domain-containing protein [Paracrocinitomix mangrovi]
MKIKVIIATLTCLLFTSISKAQCSGFSMTISTNNPTCYGFSDGSLTVNTTGGTGNINYTITDSVGNVLNLGNANTSNNLLEGWYYVLVTDQVPCTLYDSVYLDAPDEMMIDLVIDEALCYGDTSAWVYVDTIYNWTGAYNQIMYFWNPIPVGNTNGVGTDSIFNVPSGNYLLGVVDENGCSISENFIVPDAPSQVVIDSLVYQNCVSGGDGSASLYASGGTAPYTYLWYNNATGDSLNTQSVSGLDAGVYYYEVYDANGCILSQVGDSLTLGCVGMVDLDVEFKMYPNPTTGLLTVDLGNQLIDALMVYDLLGNAVLELHHVSGIIFVDLSEVSAGTYLVYLTHQDAVKVKKVVVE